MKKSKKSRKLKAPKLIRRPIEAGRTKLAARGGKSPEQKVEEALQTVPRITNETLGEHREEVLSSARKYIYPLQHSKHRVVRTSLGLLALLLVAFFVLCGLELYKFQNTGGFIYDVTRIVPFPVAKAGGGHWISYESYLFELRRNIHYYQTQQAADFSSTGGWPLQLQRLKQQAMGQVVQFAYVKQLAAEHGVSVSDQDVNKQVALVRQQNRLGSNDHVFKEVLSEFWGWSEADFKRELKQQLLKQAVAAKLDTQTNARAQSALKQLQGGADFGQLASQLSDDPATKANSGQYASAITPNDRDLAPTVVDELFKLKPGQTSGVINAGYTLEILKVIDRNGDSLHAAHIQFNLQDVSTYVKPLQARQPGHQFIKL